MPLNRMSIKIKIVESEQGLETSNDVYKHAGCKLEEN